MPLEMRWHMAGRMVKSCRVEDGNAGEGMRSSRRHRHAAGEGAIFSATPADGKWSQVWEHDGTRMQEKNERNSVVEGLMSARANLWGMPVCLGGTIVCVREVRNRPSVPRKRKMECLFHQETY